MSPINLDGGAPSGTPAPPTGLNTTQFILLLAKQQLQDVTGQAWNESNLVPYLNLIINEIINIKPEAYTATHTAQLLPGSRQPFADLFSGTGLNIVQMLEMTANMGASGTARGKAITSIPRAQINELVPDWQTFAANTVVEFSVVDPRDPKVIHVFPPQPSTGMHHAEFLLSVIPPLIEDTEAAFPLDDSYITACADGITGRALLEETSIPNAQAKGQYFIKKFYQDLGFKSTVEQQHHKEGK